MNTDYLKGWDVKEQFARTKRIERLYKESGRTNGLYTGLHQADIEKNSNKLE